MATNYLSVCYTPPVPSSSRVLQHTHHTGCHGGVCVRVCVRVCVCERERTGLRGMVKSLNPQFIRMMSFCQASRMHTSAEEHVCVRQCVSVCVCVCVCV